MEIDFFMVYEDDFIEMVVYMMDWWKIWYMLVENIKGKFIGLIISRMMLCFFVNGKIVNGEKVDVVCEIMIVDFIIIYFNVNIVEVMYLMWERKIGCLFVVNDGEFIGIIMEMDFVRIFGCLFE